MGTEFTSPSGRGSHPFMYTPQFTGGVPPVFHDSLRGSRDSTPRASQTPAKKVLPSGGRAPMQVEKLKYPEMTAVNRSVWAAFCVRCRRGQTHALIPRSAFEEISRDTWWNSS